MKFENLDASANNSDQLPGEPSPPHPARIPQPSPTAERSKRSVDGEHGQLILGIEVSSDDTRGGMSDKTGEASYSGTGQSVRTLNFPSYGVDNTSLLV